MHGVITKAQQSRGTCGGHHGTAGRSGKMATHHPTSRCQGTPEQITWPMSDLLIPAPLWPHIGSSQMAGRARGRGGHRVNHRVGGGNTAGVVFSVTTNGFRSHAVHPTVFVRG